MEHTPQHIVAQALIDLSLGTLPSDNGAWPVYGGAESDKPDSAIAVKGTAGVAEDSVQLTGYSVVHHGIQVVVRAADEKVAFAKAYAVREAMCAVANQEVELDSITYLVQCINEVSPAIPMGQQKPVANRHRLTINATVTIRRI